MQLCFVRFLGLAVFVMTLTVNATLVRAQSSDEDAADVDQIEAEIGKSAPKVAPLEENTGAPVSKGLQPQTLSDLGKLAPFSEVSVLQKRFMPKTERIQFNIGASAITNDPWFNGIGGQARLAYHLSESWGVEGTYSFLSSSSKQSATDLYANERVTTNSFVTTKAYYGLDVMWSPIYGKMSLYNKRIIPFDMYFEGGAGQSQLDGSSSSAATTLHVGTGQIYALSKAMAFRWDFSWNSYSAQTADQKSTNRFDNLILTLGFSFFFPEVKYR